MRKRERRGSGQRGGDRKSEEYQKSVEEAVPQAIDNDLRDEYLRLAEERIKVIEERGPQSRDQVGELFDVSGRSVQAAKTVLEHGTPEEIEAASNNTLAYICNNLNNQVNIQLYHPGNPGDTAQSTYANYDISYDCNYSILLNCNLSY